MGNGDFGVEGVAYLIVINNQCYHRLHESASPVLTAIHRSYGRFCDFLLFSSKTPWGQTPQPIVTRNGLNDVDSDKDVPSGVKIETFCTT